MDQTISAAEANRAFSRVLREVGEGRSFTVTSHGRPVARIVPCDVRTQAERRADWRAFVAELRARPASSEDVPRTWTREELYERD